MKTRMAKRSLSIILALAIISTISVQSQSKKEIDTTGRKFNHERTMKVLHTSLRSDIRGIVEGSIYTIVLYKKYFPELDYSNLMDEMQSVAQTSKYPSVCYKAYLATMYLNNSNTIEVMPISNPDEHEYIFREIAQQLEAKLLAYKDVNQR